MGGSAPDRKTSLTLSLTHPLTAYFLSTRHVPGEVWAAAVTTQALPPQSRLLCGSYVLLVETDSKQDKQVKQLLVTVPRGRGQRAVGSGGEGSHGPSREQRLGRRQVQRPWGSRMAWMRVVAAGECGGGV